MTPPPTPQPNDPTLTETQLQTLVIQLAQLRGWRVAHFRAARTDKGWRTPVAGDGAGFPDLIMVRGGRLVAAELKSARGRLRPEQEVWLAALEAAGVEVFVWRPADWDALERVLR